jgi:tight adherence protein B
VIVALASKWAAVTLLAAALGVVAWSMMVDQDGVAQVAWARYCGSLEGKLRRGFVFRPAYPIALAQLAGLVLIGAAAPFARASWTVVVALVVVVTLGPSFVLGRRLARRLRLIDGQVEGLLMAISNALKSRPAIGDAIASVVAMSPSPLRQELDLTVKQMRLGSSVDQALLHMSGRVGSRQLDTALSAILIGRQVGGNLSTILETTAETMREMARLEGVVRTKTAQGKAQIWVLAFFPFVLMLGFNLVSRGYFEPLTSSAIGCVCTAIALALWAGSLVLARKILAVDI